MEEHGNTDEKGAHSWNYVYHKDENKWYAVDVTWDNYKVNNKPTSYSYFMIGKNTSIKYNSGTYLFSQNHIVGLKNYKDQTYTPSAPELSEDAYKKFSGIINRNTTKKTNQPVIITATFNRELKVIPDGWIISDDKMSMTKTYEENTNEKHTVVNIRGEKLNATVNITNIDKVSPEAIVSYSSNNITNQNVEVTIMANEELQRITDWTISDDKKVLKKIYKGNKTEDVEIKDIAGNTKKIGINVNNIDKNKPMLVVTYHKGENETLVTISGNEELQEIEGWTLSEDKKTLSKIYTEGISEEVQVKDLAGNIRKKNITINVVNNTDNNYIEQYSIKDNDDGSVEVIINSSKELKAKEGWIISEDKKVLSKKYDENVSEEVNFEDLEGNEIKLTINSDTFVEDFLTEVTYSNVMDNEIQVTISSNKELHELEGWVLSEDKKSLTKTYTSNIIENVILQSLDGSEQNEKIEINNIDKDPPEIQVQYSEVNIDGKVKVIMISNEELEKKENWTLSEDKKMLTRYYNTVIEDDVTVEDLHGNAQTVKIQVTEEQLKTIEEPKETNDIDYDNDNTDIEINKNEEPIQKEDNESNNGNQSTNMIKNDEEIDSVIEVENISKDSSKIQGKTDNKKVSGIILPNTGNHFKLIYLLTSIFVAIGVISYRGYKKYRDVDR